MRIVDFGSGPPIVVIPGIQGRWEWMKPGIDALARRCRVITFSLADERSCGARFDPATGFSCYVEQVREALDTAGVDRAAVCGVSYGGLIAAAFAARHPERVMSLVLVSAVPPSWSPDSRVRFYLRAPRLLSPLFCVGSLRMYREIAAANGGAVAGLRAAASHGWRAVTHMFSPGRMARRVHLLRCANIGAELAAVHVPTLVVTGDAALDRVVPVRLTREYLDIWPHARHVTIERTGHLGLLTRPEEFTRVVVPFVADAAGQTGSRRRVG
jgi:pimeloyl-ACP methyl ester carboxylesterase